MTSTPDPPSKPITIKRIRNWLRSDMLVLRWVFLGLYLTIVGCLWFSGGDQLFLLILGGVTFGCQLLFLLGGGTIHLCRPIRKRRLWMPALVAAILLGGMAGGLLLALSELCHLDEMPDNGLFGVLFWVALVGNWIGWFLVFLLATQRWNRMQTLGRITGTLLAGSLAELLITIPSHMIVSRRPGCLVGLFTMAGITAGLYAMLFAFGPAIFLLFLRPRYRREQVEGPPKDQLRWNQFGLRSMLIAMLVVGILFSGVGARMQRARKNRRIAAEIRKMQATIEHEIGTVLIDYDDHPDSLDDLFGDPGVFYVVAVESQGGLDDADLELLKRLPQLRQVTFVGAQPPSIALERLNELAHLDELSFRGTAITDADLESLKSLTNLRQLHLTDTQATEEGVERLQKALPGCVVLHY